MELTDGRSLQNIKKNHRKEIKLNVMQIKYKTLYGIVKTWMPIYIERLKPYFTTESRKSSEKIIIK